MMIAPQQELQLLSTSVADNPEPTYDPTATYNTGDRVQKNEKIYECQADNVSGVDPETDPLTWLYISPTNKMAMFDAFVSTATEDTQAIVVEIKTSDVDALALFGLHASSVRVELFDYTSGAIVYDQTRSLEIYNVTDWWEWTYEPPEYINDVFFSLPLVFDGKLKVTIEPLDGVAKCANMTYGRTRNLGATLYGATVSRRSNTYKERSKDGRVHLKQGILWKRMVVPVMIDTEQVDAVEKRLAAIDGIPTLFVGDEREGGFESLLVFGFYRDFDVPISLVKSKYQIEIESVG